MSYFSSRGQILLSMALNENKENERESVLLTATDILGKCNLVKRDSSLSDYESSDEDKDAYLPVVSDEEKGDDERNVTLKSMYDDITSILDECPEKIINDNFIKYINTVNAVSGKSDGLAVNHEDETLEQINTKDAVCDKSDDFVEKLSPNETIAKKDIPSVEKKKRCITEEQKLERNLEKYTILPPCDCRMNCPQKINETLRADINKVFNEFSFTERRLWLDNYINESKTKRKKTYSENEVPKRQFSLQFTLPSGTSKVIVCKQMFLATLGRKTDGFVTEFRKRKHSTDFDSLAPTKDGRTDKKNPHNKKDHAKIREHINSYQPAISHYSRENAPNRRYLNPEITIKNMHANYNEGNLEPVSYSTYQSIFQQENIGFSQPSVDDCSLCLNFKIHLESHGDHDTIDCMECKNFERHQIKYRESREEYQKEEPKGADTRIFVSDMQKVFVLPKLSSKEHVFVSRLVTFNQTFASKQKDDGTHYVILWHEAITGRTASDVASAYMKIISHVGVPSNVVFWADNCSGQNKNWSLLTGMVQCVNTWGPQSITLKYLETGHTFMAADSVHGCIGKKIKRQLIHNFDDFIKLCENSMNNIESILLDIPSIFQFEKGVKARNQSKDSDSPPILSELAEIQLRKGSSSMFYKTSFKDNDYKESSFLKPRAFLRIGKHNAFPEPVKTRRGISTSKKNGILNLFDQGVALDKRRFWIDIDTNESSLDLCHSRERGEEYE